MTRDELETKFQAMTRDELEAKFQANTELFLDPPRDEYGRDIEQNWVGAQLRAEDGYTRTIHGTISRTDLSWANISNVIFCLCEDTSFTKATFNGRIWFSGELHYVNFSLAKVGSEGLYLGDTVANCDFSQIHHQWDEWTSVPISTKQIWVSDTTFAEANIDLSSDQTHWDRVNFDQISATNFDQDSDRFDNCTFNNATIAGANWKRTNFDLCSFRGAFFGRLNISACEFSNTTFEGATLTRVSLKLSSDQWIFSDSGVLDLGGAYVTDITATEETLQRMGFHKPAILRYCTTYLENGSPLYRRPNGKHRLDLPPGLRQRNPEAPL